MKLITTILMILCFITRILGDGAAPNSSSSSGGKTIIVFGDDLAAGVGASTHGLVEWLKLQTGYEIINAGKAGDRAELALGRLQRDVLSRSPDIVIILLGGNDILEKRLLYETRSDLFDIVRRIQDSGGKAIILGLYSGIEKAYQEIFHDLHTFTRSAFVPNVLDGLSTNPFLGGSFPTDDDYRIMALRISPTLTAVVRAEIEPPVLSIKYATTSSGDGKVTLQWLGESGVFYEVVKGVLGSPRSGTSVVASIDGTPGQTTVTFNVTDNTGFFALRAKRLVVPE